MTDEDRERRLANHLACARDNNEREAFRAMFEEGERDRATAHVWAERIGRSPTMRRRRADRVYRCRGGAVVLRVYDLPNVGVLAVPVNARSGRGRFRRKASPWLMRTGVHSHRYIGIEDLHCRCHNEPLLSDF